MTYAGFHLSALLYGPIQIIFSLIMMYFYVGISFLCGLSIIIIVLILNYFLSIKLNKLNDKVL